MKSGYIILFLFLSTSALVYLDHFIGGNSLTNPDQIQTSRANKVSFTVKARKLLKVNGHNPPCNNKDEDIDAGDVNLHDYRPINPVPCSKSSNIRPKPTQHGAPLMPFVPKNPPPPPPPPRHEAKHGRFT